MSHQLTPRWKIALPMLGLCFACACATAAPTDASRSASHQMITIQGGEPYAVVVHGRESVFVSGNGDMTSHLDSVKKAVHGDFIWFRDAGKAYLIQDPALLARASAAWQAMDKIAAQTSVYGAQLSQHGNAMNALGQRMKAVSGSAQERGEREAISKQMDAERKPMGELSKQMSALGRQQEAASKQADASVRALLQEALKTGKAVPAPASAG